MLIVALIFSIFMGSSQSSHARDEGLGAPLASLNMSIDVSVHESRQASFFEALAVRVYSKQQDLHRDLQQRLRNWHTSGDFNAAWGLILASFFYGIFHAAGPGHGKFVITTYLLVNRQHVTQGVILAVASAMLQGVVALVLVQGIVLFAGVFPGSNQAAVLWSERASSVLLVAVGLILSFRGIRSLKHSFRHKGDLHHHPEGHGSQCCDGHTHIASPEQIARTHGIWPWMLLVFSIGLRPCTGAIIVLVFANVMGIWPAGAGAVMAMSTGTAMAVAGMAFLAVNAGQWAHNLIGHESVLTKRIGSGSAILAGVVVAVLGASLLQGSFVAVHPLVP